MQKQKKEIKEIILTVKITETKMKRIDFFADKMKLNRSQLVRNIIDASLDDIELMNSTGMLTMALKGLDILDVIKTALRKDNFKVENGNKLIIDL